MQEFSSKELISRNILCGNSANFQGDERDVVFLSIVDSGDGSGPLNMLNFGPDDAYRKRYNVAASRAKDQLWVVDSLDPACDLKAGDIRKMLIDYSINPQIASIEKGKIEEQAESPFEEAVAKALSRRGYHLVQQWKVGAYRLDIVAVCGKNTAAIECDGDRWHSGEAKIREDMERQTILERLGWRFIRIRGSEFYRDAEKTIDRVVSELEKFGIKPEASTPEHTEDRETELLRRVKNRAERILQSETKKSEPIPPLPIADPEPKPPTGVSNGGKVPAPTPRPNPVPVPTPKPDPVPVPTPKPDPIPAPVPKPDPVPTPRSRTPDSGAGNPGIASRDSKASRVIAILNERNIKYIDKRPVGGNFWVIGGRELKPVILECQKFGVRFSYAENGGKATGHKSAWFSTL